MTGAALAVALALWAQGILVFALAAVLYDRRIPRILRGEISVPEVERDGSKWPEDTQRASKAYSNQFELPMLLFVAGMASIWLGAGWWEAALCWLFIVSRCVQAFAHVVSNRVTLRFQAYCMGLFMIVALWITLGVRLVLAGLA